VLIECKAADRAMGLWEGEARRSLSICQRRRRRLRAFTNQTLLLVPLEAPPRPQTQPGAFLAPSSVPPTNNKMAPKTHHESYITDDRKAEIKEMLEERGFDTDRLSKPECEWIDRALKAHCEF
jgi:hypothetical protein